MVQKFMVARVVICVHTTQTVHLYTDTVERHSENTDICQSSQPSTGFPLLNSLLYSN